MSEKFILVSLLSLSTLMAMNDESRNVSLKDELVEKVATKIADIKRDIIPPIPFPPTPPVLYRDYMSNYYYESPCGAMQHINVFICH
jgi:hypothetical protein